MRKTDRRLDWRRFIFVLAVLMLGSVLLMVAGCGRGAPNNVNPQVTEPPAKESDSGDNTPEAPFDQDATDEAADHVVVPPTLLAAAQTGV